MKKLLMGALVAASVIGVSTAEAAIITLTPGSSFTGTIDTAGPGQQTCPTCSAEITFALSADGTTLTLTLENTSTDGVSGLNIITAVGFDSTPDLALSDVSVALSGAFASGWDVFDKGHGLGGLGFDLIAATTTGIGPGLDDGDTGTATFTFAALDSLTINAAGIHIQALLDGSSTKFVCCSEGEGGGGEGEGGGGEGEGAAPEPASLLLLGLGLSGVAARMARKNRA